MKIGCAFKSILLQTIVLAFFLAGSSSAADLSFQSETILRVFETDVRENGDDKGKTVVPLYEYLRLDLENLSEKNLSFHAFGWGRHDFSQSNFFDKDTDGEFLYGYLQYSGSTDNLLVRVGRQYIFGVDSDSSLDGILVNTDISPWLSISAFGGQPSSLRSENGRGGDLTAGGRISLHQGNSIQFGLFYKYVANDSNRDEEEVGFDLSSYLPKGVSLSGRSRWNLVTDGWAEHSYQGLGRILGVQIRPFFEYFEYENFFNERENSADPFRFLAETEEKITTFGSDFTYPVIPSVDVGAKLKYYDYDKRDESAQYISALAVWRWELLSEWGAELGLMNGDGSENCYFLGRTYVYKTLPPGFVTGDFVYAHYDEEILGRDYSVFFSLGAGRNFLDDALEVKLSGDFSSDPYFDTNLRGMLNVRYNFKQSISPETQQVKPDAPAKSLKERMEP
jgi:hypothetical protein